MTAWIETATEKEIRKVYQFLQRAARADHHSDITFEVLVKQVQNTRGWTVSHYFRRDETKTLQKFVLYVSSGGRFAERNDPVFGAILDGRARAVGDQIEDERMEK